MALLASACLLGLTVVGCGGDSATPTTPTVPVNARVSFEYSAPTALDPAVDFDSCTPEQVRFSVHLHFTWNFWDDRRSMRAEGENLWIYEGDVPAGQPVVIALHDPNNCPQGDVYIAPTALRANGVLLTRVTQGQQGEVLAFSVQPDGTVTP